MRVSGKPVEKKIKFNNNSELTQDTKDALMNHVRHEIAAHSRVPQNLDHSLSNAKSTWKTEKGPLTGYGSGNTRQIISESKVEFYHTHLDSSLHMYAPIITPHQGLYLYQIYNGKSTGVPIVIWGTLNPKDERFKDRLHLKMIQEEDFDKFKSKTNNSTVSRKYDGASTHFSTTGQGFKFFSPRYSKITGHRIEYTYKLCELAEQGFGPIRPDRISHTTGMGEVLFWRTNTFGTISQYLFNARGIEGLCWSYLKAPEIGGILNSSQVRPTWAYPEVRIYRIDRFKGRDYNEAPFFENRALQVQVAHSNQYFKVVQIVNPTINRKWEGLVAIPLGASVNDGLKIKWRGDLLDWRIDDIKFYLSDKNNIAGIVKCTSLESGKSFNLGQGQVGTVDRCMSMIKSPKDWIGTVVKVSGFNGHEGRAAKIRDIHLDKGVA